MDMESFDTYSKFPTIPPFVRRRYLSCDCAIGGPHCISLHDCSTSQKRNSIMRAAFLKKNAEHLTGCLLLDVPTVGEEDIVWLFTGIPSPVLSCADWNLSASGSKLLPSFSYSQMRWFFECTAFQALSAFLLLSREWTKGWSILQGYYNSLETALCLDVVKILQ